MVERAVICWDIAPLVVVVWGLTIDFFNGDKFLGLAEREDVLSTNVALI